jgi:hypothetical protein
LEEVQSGVSQNNSDVHNDDDAITAEEIIEEKDMEDDASLDDTSLGDDWATQDVTPDAQDISIPALRTDEAYDITLPAIREGISEESTNSLPCAGEIEGDRLVAVLGNGERVQTAPRHSCPEVHNGPHHRHNSSYSDLPLERRGSYPMGL